MEVDDLKLYSVIVDTGSGVLFQPMNHEYTYILTVKHNFFNTIQVDGRPDKYEEKADGTNIEINQLVLDDGDWSSQPLDIILEKGENYFPHKTADIAILKINYIPGFDKLFGLDDYTINDDYYLCGFPDNKRGANIDNYPNQYTNHNILNKIGSINNLVEVRLSQQKTQGDINGMSGGGILKLNDTCISIIGIQSQMAKAISPENEIDFVPIKHFNEIIGYPENADKLMPLLPPYMASFDFLKDKIIKLEEAHDPNFKTKIRNVINEQIKFINLCPLDIFRSNFNNQLLVNGEKSTVLYSKEIWISWFEYLFVLSVMSDKNINGDDVENSFNEKRLIHSDTKGSWIEIIPQILNSNFDGMKEESVLIVSTKKGPLARKRLGKGYLTNITDPAVHFTIDRVNKFKKIKDIIHIKAFEIDCILENEKDLNKYSKIEIRELIIELKTKFYEFFED